MEKFYVELPDTDKCRARRFFYFEEKLKVKMVKMVNENADSF